jgi:hypothetical protein
MMNYLHVTASLYAIIARMAADAPTSAAPAGKPRKVSSKKPANPQQGDHDSGLNGAVKAAAEQPEQPESIEPLDGAEGLPDEAQAAPAPTASQAADPLDDELASAIAPEGEDVELSEADLAPPTYRSLPRRTSPPKMVPFRVFPREVGYKTIYMLAVDREAQEEGDVDTRPLNKSVRVALTNHPIAQKQVRRYEIRLGVTSLGRPFFFEMNLEDSRTWGQTRRDLVAIAETKWVFSTNDRSLGYIPHDSDHEGDPALPTQSFEELFLLTYKPALITSMAHPVIRRMALRKIKSKP